MRPEDFGPDTEEDKRFDREMDWGVKTMRMDISVGSRWSSETGNVWEVVGRRADGMYDVERISNGTGRDTFDKGSPYCWSAECFHGLTRVPSGWDSV